MFYFSLKTSNIWSINKGLRNYLCHTLYLNYVCQTFAGLGSHLSALLVKVIPIPSCPLNTTFRSVTPYTHIYYWFYQATVAAQDSGSKMIINM